MAEFLGGGLAPVLERGGRAGAGPSDTSARSWAARVARRADVPSGRPTARRDPWAARAAPWPCAQSRESSPGAISIPGRPSWSRPTYARLSSSRCSWNPTYWGGLLQVGNKRCWTGSRKRHPSPRSRSPSHSVGKSRCQRGHIAASVRRAPRRSLHSGTMRLAS